MKKPIISIIILSQVGLISCGPLEQFKANRSFDSFKASGRITSTTEGCSSYTTEKPPVDFLFLWDNSGSQYFVNSGTKRALNNTLNLISNNFDYHVVMAPLLGEYGSGKTSTQVNSEAFLFVSNLDDVTSNMQRIPQENAITKISQFSTPRGGSTHEAGIERTISLLSKNTSNGIFRRSAYHIIVLMSNGDDTSHMQEGYRSSARGRERYQNRALTRIKAVRTTLRSEMMRLISLVPHSACNQGWKRNSIYKWMSNELYTNSDGTDQDDRTDPDSYDICNTGFVHLFDGLNQSIQPQISKHVYNHWLITKKSTFLLADDEEGIAVHKYLEDGSSTLLSKMDCSSGNTPSSGYCYLGRRAN
ncbi:MAG: hypothetical protein OXB84_08805, partial [Halobacteriovoraceae bacterium]|nr:hypothetical protein [Halobacteriovoraceae bacterium]